MFVYGVYDVKDKEQCLGVFASKKEVKEYFDSPYSTISNAIHRGKKLKYQFEVIEIEIDENEKESD